MILRDFFLLDETRQRNEEAVEGADRLGTPSGRWGALAGLGKALYKRGDDEGAATAYRQSADAVRAFASTLTPEHANSLINAPSITEILTLQP